MMFKRPLSSVIASLILSASLAAQQGQPPSMTIAQTSLKAGGVATISYTNSALANQTIIIDVDNGMRRGTLTSVVEIHLDANGAGTAVWQVPSWLGANFNAPGVSEVHRVIV